MATVIITSIESPHKYSETSVCVCVHSEMCVNPHQQQQQHHISVITGTGHVQRRPKVFILMIDVQASFYQNLSSKHVVMACTLEKSGSEQHYRYLRQTTAM